MSTVQKKKKAHAATKLSNKRLRDEVEDNDHDEQPRKRVTKDKRSGKDNDADRDVHLITQTRLNIDAKHSSQARVVESIGDLFASPKGSVLVHACNCEGSWGGGIALAFRKNYPAACQIYQDHCDQENDLIGTCLLIPPQTESDNAGERDRDHWIGCLFTSVGKGRTKDSKMSILKATTPAMEDLLQQIKQLGQASDDGSEKQPGELKMCKINSGLFSVPWKRTKTAVERVLQKDGGALSIEVISRSEDD